MVIRGIAFDLEGTVIDVEAAHHEGHIAVAREVGLVITLDQAYSKLPHFIGGPDEKVCEDIWNLLDQEMQKRISVKEMLRRDEFHYEKSLKTMPIGPRPGFLDLHKTALELGLKLTIGSAVPEKYAMTLLNRSGLTDIFGQSNIILLRHVAHPKPAPDVFLKTAEIMGIDPKEQLVFEDSPRGVKAGVAAGSKVIGMPVVIRGSTVGALVDAGAIRIFFDWREINLSALLKNLS